jgi:hypothetical protein
VRLSADDRTEGGPLRNHRSVVGVACYNPPGNSIGSWFEIIEATPEKLRDVSGIGEFRAGKNAAGWAE